MVDALRAFIDQRIDGRLRDYEAGRPPSKPLEPTTGEGDDEIRKWYGRVADIMLSAGLKVLTRNGARGFFALVGFGLIVLGTLVTLQII